MRFRYRSIVVAVQDGDFLVIERPEIPLKLIGPHDSSIVRGLVDTGADYTILPTSVADSLGIPLRLAHGMDAKGFGGQRVALLEGEIVMELGSDDETIRWSDTVCFHDFADAADESIVLGHAGFPNYFTATLDGLEGLLTLAPNIELPAC